MATAVNHPLMVHKLTILRDISTSHKKFRELASEITVLLAYEALKNVPTEEIDIETPLVKTKGRSIVNDFVIVPILRAGVGMLNGLLDLIPTAKVGFVGLYRDPKSHQPVEYYQKLPENATDPYVLIVDPMLATGGSIIATIEILKKKGFNKIKILSIIASPEGIKEVEKCHDDVEIYVGNIDEYLNDKKYIIPGLGDAGDRLFGTK